MQEKRKRIPIFFNEYEEGRVRREFQNELDVLSELKEKADIIRAKFSACSDRELAYFADSIYFSKFESIGEHVKSFANEYDPSLPF